MRLAEKLDWKGLTLSELLLFAVTIFATVHIDGVNRLQYRGVLLKKHVFLDST
jgi:hypothetical protein